LKKGEQIIRTGALNSAIFQLARGSIKIDFQGSAPPIILDRASDTKFSNRLPPSSCIVGEYVRSHASSLIHPQSFVNGGFTSGSVASNEDNTAVYVIPDYYLNVIFECQPFFAGKFYRYVSELIAQRATLIDPPIFPIDEEIAANTVFESIDDMSAFRTAASTDQGDSRKKAAVSFVPSPFFDAFYQDEADTKFFDKRPLYLIRVSDMTDNTSKFIRRLMATLSGYIDRKNDVLRGSTSNDEDVSFLFDAAAMDVTVVDVDTEGFAASLERSISSSRLASAIVLIHPGPSRTVASVLKWLGDNRPKVPVFPIGMPNPPARNKKESERNVRLHRSLPPSHLPAWPKQGDDGIQGHRQRRVAQVDGLH
jgi:hypothetical protein